MESSRSAGNGRAAAATVASFAEVDGIELFYGRVPVLFGVSFHVGRRIRNVAGSLSGGEQQQLAIAKALLTDPTLLFVDELSLGLSPTIVAELFDVVRKVYADGVTCVIVEQSLSIAAELCNRAV